MSDIQKKNTYHPFYDYNKAGIIQQIERFPTEIELLL